MVSVKISSRLQIVIGLNRYGEPGISQSGWVCFVGFIVFAVLIGCYCCVAENVFENADVVLIIEDW
jgi:hypothetical protein